MRGSAELGLSTSSCEPVHGKEQAGFVILIGTCGRLPSAVVNHKFFGIFASAFWVSDSYTKTPALQC